jgi:glycosyltransferase involved in cell wall biosynthesis
VRVLVVSQYFWPESFRINELVLALDSKGVELEVLTGKPNYPGGAVFEGYKAWGCSHESFNGVHLHRVPLIPRGKGSFRLALNYLSFILSGLAFASWLLRGRRFDAVFVFGTSPILQAIPAIWLGWTKKCPVLLWVQDLWPESLSATGHVTDPGTLKAVTHVVRWIYQKVDLLLVQSRAFIPRVQSLVPEKLVVYYPNSFLEDKPGSALPELYCPGLDRGFPILFAGNLGKAQALDVVLEAATLLRDLPDICFVMVGDGSRHNWAKQEAETRGLDNLVFPGRFPVEAMPALMGKAAALLVTLADTEIFRLTIPSKVQAYMAAGRPVVACLNGAGAELVREAGAGVVVPAEDGVALARAIRALHAEPAPARAAMGARGRRYYEEHFSQEKLVNELIVHFHQCTQRYRDNQK